MYNKKVLSEILKKIDKPKSQAKSKDIITDPMGQWKYPGLPTRIPSNEITMEGVPYPVLGIPDKGAPKLMMPGQYYNFEEAEYVDEYPQLQSGGQIFTYKGRPGSYYKKDSKGNWLIKNEGTNNAYVPIKDPTGSRAKILNAQATPMTESRAPATQSSKYDPLYNPKYSQIAESTAVRNTETKAAPNLVGKTPLKRMREDTRQKILKKDKDVQEYYKAYHESPRYQEMLQKSAPDDWRDYYYGRNINLLGYNGDDKPKVFINSTQPKEEPRTGGFSNVYTGDITVLPAGYNVNTVLPHEWSHSTDRPLHGQGMRLIPFADRMYIYQHSPKNWFESAEFDRQDEKTKKISRKFLPHPEFLKAQQEWYNYVSDPTETRARLNDIRYQSKKKGIYDPFTEKVTPATYKKLLNTKFEEKGNEGFGGLKQLRDLYSDEEIQWMLNNISKNETPQQEDQAFARKGGGLNSKKYTKSLEGIGELFKESKLFEKPKSKKKKLFHPKAKYFQDGGAATPEEWEQEIRAVESQIGNPSGWSLSDYNQLQNKLNDYRSWRETTPEGQAVIDYHNEEGQYDIPLPEHLQDYTNAMMKSRLAYANEFGNPAAQRMVVAPDQPYIYTGQEYDEGWQQPVGVPAGEIGTHYMGSFDNYAIPFIQQGQNNLVFNSNPQARDREAIRFDNPEDAQYFSKHYKEIAPDPSYQNYIETDLTDEETEEYRKGGYIVGDISVPMLTRAQDGGLMPHPAANMDPLERDAFNNANAERYMDIASRLPQRAQQSTSDWAFDQGLYDQPWVSMNGTIKSPLDAMHYEREFDKDSGMWRPYHEAVWDPNKFEHGGLIKVPKQHKINKLNKFIR